MNSEISISGRRMFMRRRRKVEREETDEGSFIKKLVSWSWLLLLITSFLQVLIFSTVENSIGVACVIIAWGITSKVFLQIKTLKVFPLSAFLVIGFSSTQFYFPLLFTLLEGKPLVFNLELPYQVFFHSIASLLVLVTAHYIYRLLPAQTYRAKTSLLRRAGYFEPPSEIQMWLIGLIGLAANIYVFFISTSTGTQVSGDPSEKAILALISFAYAPYFIPFTSLYGSNKPISKKIFSLLIAYTVVLFIISMARNSRGAFMIGFTSVGFTYMLGMLIGAIKPPVISFKTAIFAVLGFWLITGPLSDLGTAMVIVRAQRKEISKAELIDLTLEAFKDKKAIMLRRLSDNTETEGTWDERYLDNVFTARFANIKFNDVSLVQAAKIGIDNPSMQKFSSDYLWGALPSPILKVLHPSVDKEMVYSLSFGDYIYSLAGAGTSVYGGFRTGHFAGIGMATFGLWYLLILGIVMIPVYLLFDKLVIIKQRYGLSTSSSKRSQLCFSVCGLLALTTIFQFLPTESVVGIGTFLIRGWIQMVLLYFFIFQLTRLACKYIPWLASKPASHSPNTPFQFYN